MPFILHQNNEGAISPLFRCDVCGELISDAQGALLVWDLDQYKQEFIAPRVVCKGACDQKPQSFFSMELDTALVWLLNGSGMTPEKLAIATRNAHLLAQVS
jgi:hypothetical protein